MIGSIISGIGAIGGLVQAIGAGKKRNRAEKALEAQVKGFQPNASIIDLYNKQLAKYNPNPYQSAAFGQQKNMIDRNLATGLNAAQNKRMGLSALGGLVQQANDNSARAAGAAEAAGRQDLGQLAQAAQMKTNEQQKKFDMMYNLTAQKAGAYAQTQNTGIQNLFSGLSNAAYMYDSNNDNNNDNVNNWDNGINAGANAYKMPRIRASF